MALDEPPCKESGDPGENHSVAIGIPGDSCSPLYTAETFVCDNLYAPVMARILQLQQA
ncbi:hypothetical protein [Phyllobacterium sp. SB3]|uniref:hypothetical protein n=1 Tax=Phyllobacterium sp. SB3 TaxID=3156073 RepID=UPI0032AFF1E6